MSRTAQRTKHEPVAVAVAVVLQELAALGLRGAADGEQQGCEAEGLDLHHGEALGAAVGRGGRDQGQDEKGWPLPARAYSLKIWCCQHGRTT